MRRLPLHGALLLALAAGVFALAEDALAGTHLVCPDCAYSSVGAAIAAAGPGDRIVVSGGTYREGTIVVDKSLTLTGQGWPVLDGEGRHEVLLITADDVTVEGFVLRSTGTSHTEDRAAIKTMQVQGCVIRDNRIEDAFFGIYLGKTRHCEVVGNVVHGEAVSEAGSGNAIHLWDCLDVTVADNDLRGHRDGIYLEFVRAGNVHGNVSQDNARYGLHFMFSDDSSYRDNTFRRNAAGVAVMYSRRIEMVGNRFEENWGPSVYGLLLKEINDSYIAGNIFDRNSVGVYFDGANRTDVTLNDFTRNGYAIRVLGSSMGVAVRQNNFIGNTFDVSTNSPRSYNTFVENYWDAYQGYDLDRDGIGDVPYRPVRRFALIIESFPESMVLLRSPLQQVMDYAERVVPVFTPDAIKDSRPLMRPVRW